MNVLVTGANGFIGRNLRAWLARNPELDVLAFDQENTPDELAAQLAMADFVFHLAGVNRPQSEHEFRTGNVDLTESVCSGLRAAGQATPIVLASSIQVDLDNPYGASKRGAEEIVARYAKAAGAAAIIYRLKNVFGKWCRPNYNSVVATFCHNISHDLPITTSDPTRELELIHIDDVIARFIDELAHAPAPGVHYRTVEPSYRVTLGELAEQIRAFRAMRESLQVPDLANEFTRKLYGTYLSYLEGDNFAYSLTKKCDERGCLAEFIKSPTSGQFFISRTLPGVTRGNHYHHTKTEKFLVLEGEAVIRFRSIKSGVRRRESEVIEYRSSGKDLRVVDIPPGYTHSIENVGPGELVTLFWASEVFDPERPDTDFLAV